MHKKTSKRSTVCIPLASKGKASQNLMKISTGLEASTSSINKNESRKSRGKRRDTNETFEAIKTVESKGKHDSDGRDWERRSSDASASWSEDMEQIATRKVLQQWEAVESMLYEKKNQLEAGPLFDECLQWRNQLPHLRIIGESIGPKSSSGSNSSNSSNGNECDKNIQDVSLKKRRASQLLDPAVSTKGSSSSAGQNGKELRKDVYNQLAEYICSELLLYEREIENSLCNDLEDVLRIDPVPIGTNVVSKNLSRSAKVRSLPCAKISNDDNIPYPFQVHKKVSRVTPRSDNLHSEERDLLEVLDSKSPETIERNKAGMIFDEKIVVSPVPFILSTKQSFSTLKTHPIQFLGQPMDLSIHQAVLARNVNSAHRLISPRRMSLTRLPQIHSAWKSTSDTSKQPHPLRKVKLAPMNMATLPSPIKRSATASTAVSCRHRNSQSPVNRLEAAAATAAKGKKGGIAAAAMEKIEPLEIQGTRIGQSSAPCKNSKHIRQGKKMED